MPVPGRELKNGRSYAQDGLKGAARRRWLVDAPGRAAAMLYMSENAIAYGSTHPELPGFYLDRFNLTPNDDETYYIDADYSPAGAFKFDSVTKENVAGQPKYVRVNIGFYDWQIEVPYAVKVQMKVAGGGTPPTVTTVNVWTANRFFVPRTDLVLEIEVRTSKLLYADASFIASQVDKIHKFSTSPGFEWLFLGCAPQNVNDSEDLLKYSWKRDWGSPGWGTGAGQLPQPDDTRILLPGVGRSQHCKWFMNLPDDPQAVAPNDKPTFKSQQLKDLDSTTGYQSLPGLAAAITL